MVRLADIESAVVEELAFDFRQPVLPNAIGSHPDIRDALALRLGGNRKASRRRIQIAVGRMTITALPDVRMRLDQGCHCRDEFLALHAAISRSMA